MARAVRTPGRSRYRDERPRTGLRSSRSGFGRDEASLIHARAACKSSPSTPPSRRCRGPVGAPRAGVRRPRVEVLLLATDDAARNKDGTVSRRRLGNVDVVEVSHARIATSPQDTLSNPPVLRAIGGVLDEFRPDVAHLHHLMYLGLGLVDLLRQRQVPRLLTLHEYWLLCARGGSSSGPMELFASARKWRPARDA